MADRGMKERKLLALMVNDLGVIDVKEPEMGEMKSEIHDLSDEDLDKTRGARASL